MDAGGSELVRYLTDGTLGRRQVYYLTLVARRSTLPALRAAPPVSRHVVQPVPGADGAGMEGGTPTLSTQGLGRSGDRTHGRGGPGERSLCLPMRHDAIVLRRLAARDARAQRCDKETQLLEKQQLETALARTGMDMGGSVASFRST